MFSAVQQPASHSRGSLAGDSQPLAGEAERIELEMRNVRAELRDDVREIVTSAQIMGEWQYYVRRYPWLCVGLAAAAGYFLVPARPVLVHPDAKALLELARANKLEIKMEDPRARRGGIVEGAVGLLVGAAVNGAITVANQFLQDLMTPPSAKAAPPAGEASR